jgi:hypothetical protein
VKEVAPTAITLAWDSPDSDGGTPITGYVIDKADAKRLNYTVSGRTDAATLSYRASKLHEGGDYMFQLCAENEVGLSAPVTLSEPVMAKLPFGESHLLQLQ